MKYVGEDFSLCRPPAWLDSALRSSELLLSKLDEAPGQRSFGLAKLEAYGSVFNIDYASRSVDRKVLFLQLSAV